MRPTDSTPWATGHVDDAAVRVGGERPMVRCEMQATMHGVSLPPIRRST